MMNPLEAMLLRRLRAADLDAERTEHGFHDAHARARIGGDRVGVDIPSPGFEISGRVRAVATYSGVRAQNVSAAFGGVSWRFGCRLTGFGDRAVLLSRVSDPRTVIPAAYRLLGCKPAVLPARLTKAAYERRLRELAAPLQRLPTRTDVTGEQIIRRALVEVHRVAVRLRTVHPPFAAQRAHDDFAYAYEQAVDLKTTTMQAFLGDGTGGTPGERLAERRLSATARAALARARRYFAAHDYDVDLRMPR